MSFQPPGPPTYDDVVESNPRDQLADQEPVSLVLDGTSIHPSDQPWRPIFELSNAPAQTSATIYGVEWVRYRLSATDGEGEIRSRTDHIYDFRRAAEVQRDVEISGQSSNKHAYRLVILHGGLKWHSCHATGHFRAKRSVGQRIRNNRDEIDWTDEGGKLVAVETRVERLTDNTMATLPKLELKTVLEPKDLDLLVTCWAARVWKESQKGLKEPMSWQKFKRIASAGTDKGFGAAFFG